MKFEKHSNNKNTVLVTPVMYMTLASFPGLHAHLLSLAVQKVGGRSDRSRHVIRAATVIKRHHFKKSIVAQLCTKAGQRPKESHTELIQARNLTFDVVLSCKCCTFQSDGSLHGVNSQSASKL